jgi:arylsulfatase A-like enzyme
VPDPHLPYVEHTEFNFGSKLEDRYDGEIAFTDHHLGRLFDWMEATGRMDDTMIVIMADHAESLGERGVYKHSTQLYNEQARIPMIFYVPGLAPRRVSDFVSSIDLGTTILDAVGISPPREYAGVSLLRLMRGEPFTHPPVYGEQVYTHDSRYVPPEKYVHPATKKYMVITQDGYKLIYNRDFYTFELFNLRDDPREERNLFDRMPAKAEELKKLVGRFVDITIASRPWDAVEVWVAPTKKRKMFGLDREDDADE